MRNLVRFTNIFGEINHGIVLATDPSTGMHLVQFDAFTELLARLEARGAVKDFVRTGLSMRQSWVRAPRVGEYGDKTELLPIETPVVWSCRELREAQEEAQARA